MQNEEKMGICVKGYFGNFMGPISLEVYIVRYNA